jgi:hypothetical protein
MKGMDDLLLKYTEYIEEGDPVEALLNRTLIYRC